MYSLYQFGRWGFLMVLLSLRSTVGWPQTVPGDSPPETLPAHWPNPTPLRKEGTCPKAAVGRPIYSGQAADSLFSRAHRQGYLSGQVVALNQLAGMGLQPEQAQPATDLQEDDEQLTEQQDEPEEAERAQNQGRRMQRRQENDTAAPEPDLPVQKASVADWSTAMPAMKSVQALKETDFIRFEADAAARFEKRRLPGRPPMPPQEGKPGRPVQVHVPARTIQLELRQIDHWLDTLLIPDHNPPQEVRQLAARRKRRDSSQAMSQAFAKEGDYAQAYHYFLQYNAYKDSLTVEATTRRLAALEYKQALLKKEAQIQGLTRQRFIREQVSRRQQQFVLALVGCVVLLVGFAFVLTRNNRAKQLANRQLSEQKETLQRTLTELKTTQAQLIQSEKMASLGELTSGIAHEIQNPLNFVNNFSEVSNELIEELKEQRQHEPRDPALEQELLDDVQQNLARIGQHGSRASAIVRGMLEHARTSPGHKELTDLNALTEKNVQLAYQGTHTPDHSFEPRLTTSFDPNLGRVLAVPQEVSRVLMNVFSNALYAVREKQEAHVPGYQPEIRVRTTREADQVKIQIRDNGTGVPVALKQKIFQPFFTTKPPGEGTGLGLSLSYDIITKGHGGTFTLESEEGQFTELTLTLPTLAA